MNKLKILLGILIVLLGIFLWVNIKGFPVSLGGTVASSNESVYLDNNRVPAKLGATCDTSVTSRIVFGDDLSTTIMVASTSRAYARLQQSRDSVGVATSSVFLSFDEGVAATVNSGLELSTTTPFIEFGIDTDFPYTGAVTAIGNSGSTTVLATICNF